MKKTLALFVAVIGVGLVVILVLFALLHTRYLTPLANHALALSRFSALSAESVEYHYPWHFTLNHATYHEQNGTKQADILIPQIDIHLRPSALKSGRFALDTLKITGVTLTRPSSLLLPLSSVPIEHLALKDAHLTDGELTAHHLNLQLHHPVWREKQLPYGTLQLSADSVTYRGETLQNLLIDADFQAENSTVYGASFTWRGANIAGQAEQYPDGWSLVNATISGLDLDFSHPIEHFLSYAPSSITQINSLDILHSSFKLHDVAFNNVEASLEHIDLTQSLWHQKKGSVSFEAESMMYYLTTAQKVPLINTTASINFTPDQIDITQFDTDIKQGRLQFSAHLHPHQVALSHVQISGVKWLEDIPTLKALLHHTEDLQALSIDQLKVQNSQFIQVEHRPYWQISGLNIEGQQLELIRHGQTRLWNGELEISANSANYGQLIANQGIIQTHSKNGAWTLERLFIPFQQGFLKGEGEWQLTQENAPWALQLVGEGVPLTSDLVHIAPLDVTGELDFSLHGNGLATSKALFNHSLNGQLQADIRDGVLHSQQPDFTQHFTLNHLALNAERGLITSNAAAIQGPEITGSLTGRLDLTNPRQEALQLKMHTSCHELYVDLYQGTAQVSSLCEPN